MIKKHDFQDLDDRAHAIFRHIVESFMRDGGPVGSRTLSRSFSLSPATIRNVMADLEFMGLLQSPHISAGRLPTDQGLRYFVDGILEKGSLSEAERAAIDAECSSLDFSANDMMEQASTMLSSLSASAGLVVAPMQAVKPLRHIEFVQLSAEKAMVILVSEDSTVENRVIDITPGITGDMLREAGNFLSEKLYGRTIGEMRDVIMEEITKRQNELNPLMTKVIEAGLAVRLADGKLVVRGRSRLLEDQAKLDDLEKLKSLMEQLESKETISKLLEEASDAQGVKIFIGSENSIFEGSGYSLVLSPYHNNNEELVGAIGVIGPTRLNYAKVIPSVNYMAELLSFRIKELYS